MVSSELRRKEMLVAGDLLLDALRVESNLTLRCARRPTDDKALQRWRKAREAVETLAAEYLKTIELYREAVRADLTELKTKKVRGARKRIPTRQILPDATS